jgi:hypothetical protein
MNAPASITITPVQLVSLQEKFNIPLDQAKCLLEQTESGLSPDAAYTACVEVPKVEQQERDIDAQRQESAQAGYSRCFIENVYRGAREHRLNSEQDVDAIIDFCS